MSRRVLDALAADLGKRRLEAYFEWVGGAAGSWSWSQRRCGAGWRPQRVGCRLSKRPGRAS